MDRRMRSGVLVAGLLAWQAVALAPSPARTEEFGGNDLRDIRLGMAATELTETGYVDFSCVADPKRTISGWKDWRDCAADASGTRSIRFGYDPSTTRDGTMVAGHPAILTLLIDDTGHVAGLQIDTDPKARLYIRKKAFLLGIQARSRYGPDGWACSEGQPESGDQPVGGVYLRERCTKTVSGRSLIVERNLFRRSDQDIKNFVDETRISYIASQGLAHRRSWWLRWSTSGSGAVSLHAERLHFSREPPFLLCGLSYIERIANGTCRSSQPANWRRRWWRRLLNPKVAI